MAEATAVSENRIGLTGMVTGAEEEDRLGLARALEQLDLRGTVGVVHALREAGPAVTVERVDSTHVVRAWLGRRWCVWALPRADDSLLAEAAIQVTAAGQIGACIARIVGLEPSPVHGVEQQQLFIGVGTLAAWCTDEAARRWRIRIVANCEVGASSSIEAVEHPTLGWFVVLPDGPGAAAHVLAPTTARFLWLLLFLRLAEALPSGE